MSNNQNRKPVVVSLNRNNVNISEKEKNGNSQSGNSARVNTKNLIKFDQEILGI
jgi:hypothetical protein